MTDPSDRDRWDAKYRSDPDWQEPRPPDPFVTAMLALLEERGARGRAVDLAGGLGRHAIELARRGWDVALWDVSAVGLEGARRFAAEAGVCLATRVVDLLAERPLAADPPFDLAVIVNFRDRELVGELPRLVRAGGYAVYAQYTTEWPGEKPPPQFRLRPGELAEGLAGLELVEYRESEGRAGVLCRMPSRPPAGPPPRAGR